MDAQNWVFRFFMWWKNGPGLVWLLVLGSVLFVAFMIFGTWVNMSAEERRWKRQGKAWREGYDEADSVERGEWK